MILPEILSKVLPYEKVPSKVPCTKVPSKVPSYFRTFVLSGIRGGQFLQARPITYHFPKKSYASPPTPTSVIFVIFWSKKGCSKIPPETLHPTPKTPIFPNFHFHFSKAKPYQKQVAKKRARPGARSARAPSLTLARRNLTNFSNFHFHFGKAKPYQSQGGIILILI